MRLNLSTALPLLARYAVQGACATDPRVVEKINEARQRLMEKPSNWKGKIQRFLFCADRACVTLPREVETVEAVTVCNHPMKMRSKWYDMLDSGPGSGPTCGCSDAIIDRGDGYVTFNEFDQPRNVKIYTDVPEATGARLLLQGFDANGNRVQTWDETTKAYADGEYVAINNETPGVSKTVFAVLDGIQKPQTNGFLRLYSFTAAIPSNPFSDTTTAEVWLGSNPLPGSLIWDGELLFAQWYDPKEDEDIVVQISFDGSNIIGNFFTPTGVPLSIAISNTGFAPTTLDWQTLGPITSGSAGTMGGTLWKYNPLPGMPALQVGDKVRNAGVVGEEFTVGFVLVQGSPGSQDFYFEIAGNTNAFTVGSSIAEYYTGVEGNLDFLTFSSDPSIASANLRVSKILAPHLWSGQFYSIRFKRKVIQEVIGTPDFLSQLSILHPDDTTPSYRRYEIPALQVCTEGQTAKSQQVILMAKLRYLPVKRGTDFLVIENIGALKHMLLAINAEEKGDFANAQLMEAKAEKILADELQNHIGDATTNNQPMRVQEDCWAAGDIASIL